MRQLFLIGAALLPYLAHGQVADTNSIGPLIQGGVQAIIVPAIFSASFLVFIWGVFQYYIIGKYDELTKEKSKSLMLWGILAFFAMLIIWLIVVTITGAFETRPPSV